MINTSENTLKIAQQAFDYFTQLVEVFPVPSPHRQLFQQPLSIRYWVKLRSVSYFLPPVGERSRLQRVALAIPLPPASFKQKLRLRSSVLLP
jgi:hypothetical protein